MLRVKPSTIVRITLALNVIKKSETVQTVLNSASCINSNLQVLSKISQVAKPINKAKSILPLAINYLNANSNKLHYLADACILKTLES